MTSLNLAMAATSSQTGVSALESSCQPAVANTYGAMDESAAIDNAISSQGYIQSAAAYSNVTYSSIFQIDKTTVPYPICTEKVLSYNVVFTLHNNTGGWAGQLVITENQNLTVLGSAIRSQFVSATNSWKLYSGYQVQANSGATQAIYEAYSEWTQPGAGYPSVGCGSYGACDVATWVGLTDAQNVASTNLNQDGTWVTCTPSGGTCSDTYYAWYEIVSNGGGLTQCTATNGGSVSLNPGDTILAWTENEAAYGGSSSKYDFYVADLTTSTSCYVYGQSDSTLTSPKYGLFVLENGEMCSSLSGPCAYLATFGTSSTVSFSSAEIYTGGSLTDINSFTFGAYNMENQAGVYPFCYGSFTTDVSYGNLGSGGDFTLTYGSSQYTGAWDTNC